MTKKYFFIIFFFLIVNLFSKDYIFTLIDKTQIKIGEPIHYSFKISKKYCNSDFMNLFQNCLKKSNIEINSYFVDSIKSKKYIDYHLFLTSFIPGQQIIPSFQFICYNKLLKTLSYVITVVEIKVNNNETYKDIKNIENISFEFVYEFLYYFIKYQKYILFFCLLFLIIYFFYKKNNKKKYKYIDTNFIFNDIIYKINKLKNKNYIEKSQFRLFYIEFSYIIKEYLSIHYQIPAKILLTVDLLKFIKSNNLIPISYYQFLLDIFKISDSVKFAKFKPDNQLCIKQLEQFIEFVNYCNNCKNKL